MHAHRLERSLFVSPLVLLALVATAAAAQDVPIYADALQNGFQDYSYGATLPDFASTAQAHSGTKSIAFPGDDFNAISLAHPTVDYGTAQYSTLSFWIHGGASGGQQLRIYLQKDGAVVAQAALDTYISGGSIVAGTWRQVMVVFGQAPLSYSGSFDRIDLQSDVGGAQPVLYVDDVSLVAGGNPPPAVNLLQAEHDVTVGSMVSDRFTWRDSANRPRVAVLAHNDGQQGPTSGYPNHGGALRELRYQMPDDTTRIASVTTYGNGGYGGFGYVVSHRADGSAGGVGDDSPLGYAFVGTYQRVFEGRHHAIFRFTQLYPRHASTTADPPNVLYNVPVTIDWVFTTGHDHPVWAVTYDLAAASVPVNALEDDTRAPYGELNFDGVGAANVEGVAWGDRYKFTTTSSPVTLNSTWTWNTPNTVPYVKLWIASTDATMGIVQTQTMTQQDAGAGRNAFYHDLTPYWGKTSAQGNAGGADKMPWQDSWPYQATSFSIGSSTPSNNTRLTWGASYGFLGQQTYDAHDIVVPSTPPGWPRKSYSSYIVLGAHSTDPVGNQVAQIETVQSLALSATTGSVRTSGPAGINRSDTVTYAPAGWNHVYGALSFNASGNALDANIGVGAGTLKKPLVIVSGYSGGYPTVKLGGATLALDADYFPSLRADAGELWLTLNANLSGGTNHLEIVPTASGAPTIQASGPTTFCAGGSVVLTASTAPGPGVSYLWSPGEQTTRAITVSASGSYAGTVTVSGAPAGSSPVTVTVNPAPSTPSITAPSTASPGASGLIASVAAHAGAGYSWGITNGTITAGQGTSQITFTAGVAGSLSLSVVEMSAAGCSSAEAGKTVTVGTPSSGRRFYTLTPCRLFDTRNAGGPDAAAPALQPGATRAFTITGRCGVPASAKVVSTNVTVTGSSGAGYLTLYPADAAAPQSSSINFRTGQTRANNTLLQLSPAGAANVLDGSVGPVHFILDVNGWFE